VAVLLPTASPLRRSLESWFQGRQLHPRVVAEYDDPALLKTAAADGLGFFALPSLACEEAVQRYGFKIIGQAAGCREQFYAVSADRKLNHPAVVAITGSARAQLFGRGRRLKVTV
jgi:LysR family transcriptional activator of nhaA